MRKIYYSSLFCCSALMLALPIYGQLSIDALSIDYTIDFSGFDGSGFTPSPAAGQLDSDTWAHSGMSDGALVFGGSGTSGDHARGSSTGGVTTGGFYAFDRGAGNVCLGFQAAGSDFTPGTLTLRIQNNTGSTVTSFDISYNIAEYNDQGRANSLNFSWSTDNSSYTPVNALDFTSTEAAAGSPAWGIVPKSTTISSLSVADGDYFYIRFESDDVSGSGSRDELGIDDIVMNAAGAGCTPPTTQASNFGTANIQTNQMDVSWTRGNGANILVVAREGGAVNADPVNSTTYTADAAFGSGTEIGTGNYVVYKGTGTSETVTSLMAATTYHYALYEFDGSGGSECYRTSDKLTGSATTLPIPPAITHTGTSPAAADISQGATNTVLYQVEVEVADGPATMTQLVAATGGTFDSDDLDNFKLWFSTDASFNSASDVLLSTISDPTTGEQTFTVSNQVFPIGTRYLFITGDVDAAATIGHTVSCGPDADGDFTYTEDETNSGSSFAVTNAMTIVGVPELQLEYPVSTNLSCGGTIPFGDLAINDHADLTFRIRNIGSADLTFSALNIAGSNPDQFSVQTQPTSPVTPGNFSDAVIRFSPSSTGAKTASITISSNDPDESSCLVNLTGTGRPVNDNCSGAITLTVESGETCNSPLITSSTGASQSIAAIECNAFTGNADDDVWFKFEATGTSHIITVDGASNMDAVVDLREGVCNGTNIACADATFDDGIEVITASGLTIGATYLIRVYDYDADGGDFTICVTTPVPPMHYRTVQSGDFSNASTWETSLNNNDPWTAALQGPDEDDLSITIRSGDDVTISTGATLDQLTIASGSSLNITGGTLLVADGSGDDMVVFGTFIN